jgi:hypothetical protein
VAWALIVTLGDVPAGVPVAVTIFMTTLTGESWVGCVEAGEKTQLAPAGKPLHEKVTVLLKPPIALTVREMGGEIAPLSMVTEFGEGALSMKSEKIS